jgi:hypothetical protein
MVDEELLFSRAELAVDPKLVFGDEGKAAVLAVNDPNRNGKRGS